MWHGTPLLDDLVLGDHEVDVVADAWYLGAATVADLPVSKATYTETYEASSAQVRSSMQLELFDENGELTPSGPTDPLAPYGQAIVVGLDLSAGIASERIPLGEFRVEPVTSASGWRDTVKRGRVVWLPTGGAMTVPLVDNLARVTDAELWGLMSPKGPTVLAEVDRLLAQVPGITTDWTGVTNKALAAGGAAYGDSRIDVLAEYARGLGLVLACDRDGAITFRNPALKTEPDLVITPEDAGRWVDATHALDRDGIYNVVEVTGQAAGGTDAPPPTGVATITDGPYSISTMGPRVLRQHSEFVSNRSQADSAARTRLATSVRGRSRRFQVTAVFDPRVQCLDTHLVTITPGTRTHTLLALLVGIEADIPSKSMRLTYEVPLEVLD